MSVGNLQGRVLKEDSMRCGWTESSRAEEWVGFLRGRSTARVRETWQGSWAQLWGLNSFLAFPRDAWSPHPRMLTCNTAPLFLVAKMLSALQRATDRFCPGLLGLPGMDFFSLRGQFSLPVNWNGMDNSLWESACHPLSWESVHTGTFFHLQVQNSSHLLQRKF